MKRVHFACRDCGRDTVPKVSARGRRDRHEYYMVYARAWARARMPSAAAETDSGGSGFLCIGCLEVRLGRTLCKKDFKKVPANAHTDPYHTPRLRNRLNATRSRRSGEATARQVGKGK